MTKQQKENWISIFVIALIVEIVFFITDTFKINVWYELIIGYFVFVILTIVDIYIHYCLFHLLGFIKS